MRGTCCLYVGFRHMLLRPPVFAMAPLQMLSPTQSSLMSSKNVACVFVLEIATLSSFTAHIIKKRKFFISITLRLVVLGCWSMDGG